MTNPWQEIKSRLGPIQFLDLTRFDLVGAHRELGKQVRDQVSQNFERRLNDIPSKRLATRIAQARGCWRRLKSYSKDHRLADELLRIAIGDYIVCLEAWSDGLELDRFSHPILDTQIAGGGLLGSCELALLLQHDNVGCQTGLYRSTSGGVQLWHTEEDADRRLGSRFDRLRIASFRNGAGDRAVRFHTFIYPDLMPGPAFGWRDDGYIQAVDSLLLHNPPQISDGLLANVICWLALRLGIATSTLDMLKSLQPYFDGYAMNLICSENQVVKATRYEFAGDRIIRSCLDPDPDSFLFQVNYFSDRSDANLQKMESLPKRTNRVMNKRMERTVQAIQDHKALADGTGLRLSHFFRMVTSRAGREWAYSNKDVKAHFLCQIEPDKMEIWLGIGPARREDVPLKIYQKI